MPVLVRPKLLRRFGSAVLIALILATGLSAGPLPNLLDDNRRNIGMAAVETAAFNLAVGALGLGFLNPVSPALMYPPVLSGRVLAHPVIHNLYTVPGWDAHSPDAPTWDQRDALTQ